MLAPQLRLAGRGDLLGILDRIRLVGASRSETGGEATDATENGWRWRIWGVGEVEDIYVEVDQRCGR